MFQYFTDLALIGAPAPQVVDGDTLEYYEPVAVDEPCLLQKRKSEYSRQQDGTYVRAEYEGFFSPNVPLDIAYHVTVADVTYLVVSIKRPRGHHAEAKLQLIAPFVLDASP